MLHSLSAWHRSWYWQVKWGWQQKHTHTKAIF
jgi:hypothetical protein